MSGELPDVERIFTQASRNMHSTAIAFAEELAEPVRSGVLRALELVPEHRVPSVSAMSDSPWVYVNQIPGLQMVVWRATGAVYEVSTDGTVGEEPVA